MKTDLKTYVTLDDARLWFHVAETNGKRLYIEIGGGSRRPTNSVRAVAGRLQFHLVDEGIWYKFTSADKIIIA